MTGLPKAQISTAMLVAAALACASSASADVDADLSKYCRTEFANSAPVTRSPGGAIAHYCNQGGSLQGIDLARACMLTTGSREYRILGERVLCADGPGPSDAASTEPLGANDFVEYCRNRFPNSTYEAVPTNLGSPHHCRRPGASGGFTLQPIDLADACRVLRGADQYRQAGGDVFCADDIPAETAERRATAAGNRGGAGSDAPDQRPDAATPEAPDAGAADGELAGRDPTASTDKGYSTAGGLAGIWEMTGNSIRSGLRVRLDVDGDQVTGTIVAYPPDLERVARTMDGLEAGQQFLVGTLSGDTITGTTRIGISASSQAMGDSGNTVCRDFVAGLEVDPNRWMQFELHRNGNTLSGRHQFVGLTLASGDECRTYQVPNTPPRLKDGYAALELVRADDPCGVVEAAPADKQPSHASKQGRKEEDGTDAAADNPYGWPQSWIDYTNEIRTTYAYTNIDLFIPWEAVRGLTIDQLSQIAEATGGNPCNLAGYRIGLMGPEFNSVSNTLNFGTFRSIIAISGVDLEKSHDMLTLWTEFLDQYPESNQRATLRRGSSAGAGPAETTLEEDLVVARAEATLYYRLLSQAEDELRDAESLEAQGLVEDSVVSDLRNAVATLEFQRNSAEQRVSELVAQQRAQNSVLQFLDEE